MTWNPLDPESVLRSKRVQGALIILASVVSQSLGGVGVSEDNLLVFADATNRVLVELGALWGLVGTITAANSARPF